ncbi:MAG: tagatose-bisphosphate aldolase [Candidatus Yonathbacteria bacterium RIFCSPHIGHO2_01_FULL_51_10]|uniref:Tagatose-bisphosphate aldolase n=1 Tax=Candidatus Yonathbacteria bacterium RIFCSPHIGHO2_01_FULL_51_10 TaxID=1802723 RepID=A0A1G2S5D1_9BACT|nr:MAG: tagatose-bisphosphate aldolase [Candidatus Yonathbacteria bacterium RIFCSPHIGHO2_01_FULL_51_10]
MQTLRETILDASSRGVAIGHFNISNIEGFWAIVHAARALGVPAIVGLSEGERDFVGVKQAVALVKATREELGYPIYINADHTYSFERVKEAVDAGFDAVIFDGAKLSLEENIKQTKACVDYARSVSASRRTDVLVEAEMGYIGQSSKILDAIPEGAVVSGDALTSPEDAARFVHETGVDLFAPAVGNIHGMLRSMPDPRLDIPRIAAIRAAAGVPLVLHGGSGTVDQDFTDAITAGISIVHINTEIRVAYRDAMRAFLNEHPDEVAPYKIAKGAVTAMEDVITKRLKLFSKMG